MLLPLSLLAALLLCRLLARGDLIERPSFGFHPHVGVPRRHGARDVAGDAHDNLRHATIIGTMNADLDRQKLAREAKAIVALAFRNGPIEEIHAGRDCPTCTGHPGFSRITDAEMRMIMKNAVDRVYALLLLRDHDPEEYESQMHFGERYTSKWDEPENAGWPRDIR